MADPYELMELEGYNRGPDPQIRSQRMKMEEELLIKLGAKKELIEFHPIILSSRLERAKTFTDLQYTRAIPPATEKSYVSRNPWHSTDQALRQMSNPPRRGPRDFVLPNLSKPATSLKVVSVPEADFGFMERREAIIHRLNILLEEWAVYERRAFPPLINRLSTLKELVPIKPAKELTKANLETHLGHASTKRKSFYSWSTSSNKSSSDGRKRKRSHKETQRKKTRWSRMTQEVLLQMKASRVRLPEIMPKSELRIYVSSTPDLQEERDFLEEVAYPKLKELCEKIGLNCHFVDMRKGSGVLRNDLETFDLIDTELDNCRRLSIGPHFVCLLGHQLDDQKLPGFLEKSVYEKIRESLVRENIIGVEMFDEAYRLDSNRVPAVYIKQPLRAIDEYQGPDHVEHILLTAMNSALDIIKDKDGEAQDFYKWSSVVREVEGGVLKSYNPRRETLCFLFDDKDQPPDSEDGQGPDLTSPVERLRHNVVTHYHRMASKNSLMKFKTGRKTITYLRSLADTFIASMASLLKAQVRHQEYDLIQQMTEGSEALQHVRVALSDANVVVEKSLPLDRVRTILEQEEEDPKVVLLVGPSGSGKSSLASQIAKNALMWDPRRKTVYRYLGITLRSSSLFRSLESLIKQLTFLYALDNTIPPDANLNDVISIFCDTVGRISACRKGHGNLLLILDNLGHFRDVDVHVFLKIINCIQEGITLVLSLDDSHPLNSLLKSKPTVKTVTMVPFNKIQLTDFMKAKLTLSNRRVTQDQMKSVFKSLPGDPMPIYFEIIFNIIRWWPSHTLPELDNFSGDTDVDFMVFLAIMERDVGTSFTRYALSLLVASRHGLADNELVHMLAEDSELLDDIKAEQDETVSVVEGFSYQLHLSRLLTLLGKFVTEVKIEGETVFQMTCQSLIRCVKEKYLKDEFFYSIHNKLATFFLFIRRGLLLSSKDIAEKKFQELSRYQWRTMRSVPYHMCFCSSDPDKVWESLKEKVFFNFSWLVNEIYSGFYIDLMEDIRFALENVDLDPDIQYLQQFLVSIAHTAIHNPLSLASMFACQKLYEQDDDIKDSVSDVIKAAREWMKQVHTQALVPVEYTMDKINRLLIKKNSLNSVTDMWSDITSANLLVRRENTLSLLNMVTGEELKLITLDNEIQTVFVKDNKDVAISTTDKEGNLHIDIVNIQQGSNVRSMPLHRKDVSWFDFRTTTEAYTSDNGGVKQINFDTKKILNACPQKKPWNYTYVTQGKHPRVVIVTVVDKMKVELLTLKTSELRMISFKKPSFNPNCEPFISTRDGKYLVLVFEREAIVVDLIKSEETETFSHKGLPIIRAELSRSHEHIFLAYMNGYLTCHVLYSGNTSMVSQITTIIPPQFKRRSSLKSERGDSRNSNSNSPYKTFSPTRKHNPSRQRSLTGDDIETINTMITSEDDHFLFCGTTAGAIYVIHVPTGMQVVKISHLHRPIKKLVYLTNKEHFQHLVSLNEDGLAFHWNLRPLIKQARASIKQYIIDTDLSMEEQPKMELREYYKSYQSQWNDRVFLNGPDIAAFYKDPPNDLFIPLENLDPAFKPVVDWENSGTIADCSEMVQVFACGKEIGDTLFTISTDNRLAKWSLFDGRLVWCKRLSVGAGDIQNAAVVYYDQAILVTERNAQDTCLTLTVTYLGDGQTKILTRRDVTGYWTSQDRCQVLLLCQSQQDEEELLFYHWDLINATESTKSYQETMLDNNHSRRDNLLFTTFSPALNQVVRLSLVDEENKNEKSTSGAEDTVESRPQTKSDTALRRFPATFPQMTLKKKNIIEKDNTTSTSIGGRSPVPVDQLRPSPIPPISPNYKQDEADIGNGNENETVTTKQVRFDDTTTTNEKNADKMENTQDYLSEEYPSDPDENRASSSLPFSINILLSWNMLDMSIPLPDIQIQAHDSSHRPSLSSPRLRAYKHRHSLQSNNDNLKTNNPMEDKVKKEDQNNAKTTTDDNSTDVTDALENDEKKQINPEMRKKTSEEVDKLSKNWCSLKLDLSAICFTGEDSLFTGTTSGHVLLLNIPTFHIACVLADEGPKLQPVDGLDKVLANVTSPHKGTITYVGTSDDGSVLVSADAGSVCLWDMSHRSLALRIPLGNGQELTHLVMSKDASVVALVTNHRIIQIWTPIGSHKEIANYMVTFDIIDLGMSSDCHKVIVRGKGQENKTVLEIFDVKNVDDVLMHVLSRTSQSQSDETRSSMASKRRSSRSMSERRRSSTAQTNTNNTLSVN